MTATTATTSATTLYLHQQQTQTSTSAYNSLYQPSLFSHDYIQAGIGSGLQQQLIMQQQYPFAQNDYRHPLTPEDYQYLSLTPAERRMMQESSQGWAIPPPPPPPESLFAPAIIGDAAKRAHELLLSHLTPKQRETFERNRWFIVEGGKSKKKYRIRDAGHLVANIDVLDNDGMRVRGLCGHCAGHDIPLYDSLLAQKLMLESSEDEFLKIANQHR